MSFLRKAICRSPPAPAKRPLGVALGVCAVFSSILIGAGPSAADPAPTVQGGQPEQDINAVVLANDVEAAAESAATENGWSVEDPANDATLQAAVVALKSGLFKFADESVLYMLLFNLPFDIAYELKQLNGETVDIYAPELKTDTLRILLPDGAQNDVDAVVGGAPVSGALSSSAQTIATNAGALPIVSDPASSYTAMATARVQQSSTQAAVAEQVFNTAAQRIVALNALRAQVVDGDVTTVYANNDPNNLDPSRYGGAGGSFKILEMNVRANIEEALANNDLFQLRALKTRMDAQSSLVSFQESKSLLAAQTGDR